MPQETPQEDATAAEASVRGAPSNPVAAQTATAASADGTLEVWLKLHLHQHHNCGQILTDILEGYGRIHIAKQRPSQTLSRSRPASIDREVTGIN